MFAKLVILFAFIVVALAAPQYAGYGYNSYPAASYPGYYGYSAYGSPLTYSGYGGYAASPYAYGYGYY